MHMSRPKPTVLLEYVNKKTYRLVQVLEADNRLFPWQPLMFHR